MMYLVFCAILALAGVATYFSVFGLMALAPAVPYSMVALGLVLEFGKYTGITFLVTHSKQLPRLLRWSLVSVTAFVVFLTSIGVFGYLQSAFSESLAATESTASLLEDASSMRHQFEVELQAIDAETKRASDNDVRGRLQLLREYADRRAGVAAELQRAREREAELKAQALKVRSHTGPLSYVATAVGVPLEKAVFWMAILLTVSLDPLALLLNMGLVHLRQRPPAVESPKLTTMPDPPPVVPEPEVPRDEPRAYEGLNTLSAYVEDMVRVPRDADEPPPPAVNTVEPPTPSVAPADDTEVAVEPLEEPPTDAPIATPGERRSVFGTRLPDEPTS